MTRKHTAFKYMTGHDYLYIISLDIHNKVQINPIALRMAKTPLSFGHSECNRVKVETIFLEDGQIKLVHT